MDAPEVMDIDQAADYLKINKQTLYEMARAGKVPSRQVGRQWRFSKAALDRWLAGDRQPVDDDKQEAS